MRPGGRTRALTPSSARSTTVARALLAGVVACLLGTGCTKKDGGDAPAGPGAAASEDLPPGLDAETAAKPVAKVGDFTITVGDLARRILREAPYLRARYQSPERRRELLDQLIDFHLLVEESERRGYGELPEVVRAEKQAMIEQLIAAHFRENPTLTEVTAEEVEAYYEAHPEEWTQPEQVRASHIQVADRAVADRILAEARAAPLRDDETWRRLVTRYHEDAASRPSFGDLGFFSAPGASEGRKVAEPIARAAFSLDAIGSVYEEPVRTDEGWHIVRKTALRPALRRKLDHVRRQVESQLWREKQDAAVAALIAELRERHDVEEHPERLDQVRLPGGPPEVGAP